MVTAEVTIALGTERLTARFSVPEEPISAADLLPIARAVAARIVQAAEEAVVAEGKTISCTKGCGACCRQLVPISRTEARLIAQMVAELPEPRRSEIADRFARAKSAMQTSGMWQTLERRADWRPDEVEQIGLDYFRQGIPCPFLEEESCGIHPDRPITCREYLVTSPAINCAAPTRENIEQVPLSLKIWPALARFDEMSGAFIPWVPLTMALEPDLGPPPPEKPGPEMLSQWIGNLTGKSVPGMIPCPSDVSLAKE
jgi:Fe-S-cluster containining protein